MSVLISQRDNRTQLGALLLDCLLTERLTFDSEVTLYPTEEGNEISDHIANKARRISITGIISTADVSGGFGFSSLFGYNSDNSTKLGDVIDIIDRMHGEKNLVEISTAQSLYTDMAFSHLEISRSADNNGGNWASITAELIKIEKVNLKTADVPAPETTAAPASGRAGQTNKPAGKSTPSGSSSNASNYGPQQSASDKTLGARIADSQGAKDLGNTLKGILGK